MRMYQSACHILLLVDFISFNAARKKVTKSMELQKYFFADAVSRVLCARPLPFETAGVVRALATATKGADFDCLSGSARSGFMRRSSEYFATIKSYRVKSN